MRNNITITTDVHLGYLRGDNHRKIKLGDYIIISGAGSSTLCQLRKVNFNAYELACVETYNLNMGDQFNSIEEVISWLDGKERDYYWRYKILQPGTKITIEIQE